MDVLHHENVISPTVNMAQTLEILKDTS